MITETNNDQPLLGEFETTYVRAESGKRFANYLIDIVCFYVFIFAGGVALGVFFPEILDSINTTSIFNLLARIIGLVLFALFMFGQEALFNGKSIGKFITKTKAVNLDGTPISINTALLRGLSRAVPFEAFSALGSPPSPWHDKWTNTMVIDEKRSAELSLTIEGH